jgi:hypothetical protein
MPYMILIPAHGLDKLISHLGVCHYITKTHLGGQDTLHSLRLDCFLLRVLTTQHGWTVWTTYGSY